jgi:hypothetical protein
MVRGLLTDMVRGLLTDMVRGLFLVTVGNCSTVDDNQ